MSFVGFWNVIDVSEKNAASVFRNELNHMDSKISCYRWVFEFTEPSKIAIRFNKCYRAVAEEVAGGNVCFVHLVATALQPSTGFSRS